MSEKLFFDWDDNELKSEIDKLIKASGEHWKGNNKPTITTKLDILANAKLTQALIFQLERVNNRLELIHAK